MGETGWVGGRLGGRRGGPAWDGMGLPTTRSALVPCLHGYESAGVSQLHSMGCRYRSAPGAVDQLPASLECSACTYVRCAYGEHALGGEMVEWMDGWNGWMDGWMGVT